MPRKKEDNKKQKAVKKEKVEVDLDSIKDELYDYTDEVVRRYYLQEIEKTNKIIIREKNKKILFRNFLITLLLLIIVYLLYLLTTVNYFSRFNIDNNTSETIETKPVKEETKESKSEPTLEELKERYEYLLNNILIDENSKYTKDYYDGNLTNELKNYLSLNNVDMSKIDEIDDYNMFSDIILKSAYEELFNDTYKSTTFNYNGNQVRYISKLNSYISTSLIKKTESNIKREIIAINIENNRILITTVEGLIKEDKLYNPKDNVEVPNYKKDSLLNYQDKLAKLIYTFENDKLINIK